MPPSAPPASGTPITGSTVRAATAPARCAAAPAAADHDLHPAPLGLGRVPVGPIGRPVGRRDRQLVRHPELREHPAGLLHHRDVGVAADQNRHARRALRARRSSSTLVS